MVTKANKTSLESIMEMLDCNLEMSVKDKFIKITKIIKKFYKTYR